MTVVAHPDARLVVEAGVVDDDIGILALLDVDTHALPVTDVSVDGVEVTGNVAPDAQTAVMMLARLDFRDDVVPDGGIGALVCLEYTLPGAGDNVRILHGANYQVVFQHEVAAIPVDCLVVAVENRVPPDDVVHAAQAQCGNSPRLPHHAVLDDTEHRSAMQPGAQPVERQPAQPNGRARNTSAVVPRTRPGPQVDGKGIDRHLDPMPDRRVTLARVHIEPASLRVVEPSARAGVGQWLVRVGFGAARGTLDIRLFVRDDCHGFRQSFAVEENLVGILGQRQEKHLLHVLLWLPLPRFDLARALNHNRVVFESSEGNEAHLAAVIFSAIGEMSDLFPVGAFLDPDSVAGRRLIRGFPDRSPRQRDVAGIGVGRPRIFLVHVVLGCRAPRIAVRQSNHGHQHPQTTTRDCSHWLS